ncbi:hypothetical protein SAMN02910342_02914, partial [Butyrivibrio sp. INlla21]
GPRHYQITAVNHAANKPAAFILQIGGLFDAYPYVKGIITYSYENATKKCTCKIFLQ